MADQQDEVIENVYEQKRTKMRRDLDNLNEEVKQKQKMLMKLLKKQRDYQKYEVRENEFDNIVATQNRDPLMNTTKKFTL